MNFYHVTLALQKAEEAERRGDTQAAERWFKVAERYENYLNTLVAKKEQRTD